MSPLPSTGHHPSYGDRLEVKREYCQNSCVLDCVTQCSQSTAHLYEQFLQVKQIEFVTWDPYALHRGSYLELYYCNMVEWFWWYSSIQAWSLTTKWFPSVLWHCWFGHLACKNHPRNDLLCVEWDVKPYTLTKLCVSCLVQWALAAWEYCSSSVHCRALWVPGTRG